MLRCPRCGVSCAPDDNYCRVCGQALRARWLPVLVRRPLAGRSALPPTVWRSLATLAVGTGLEIVRRLLWRQASALPGRLLRRAARHRPPHEEEAVIIWYRRR